MPRCAPGLALVASASLVALAMRPTTVAAAPARGAKAAALVALVEKTRPAVVHVRGILAPPERERGKPGARRPTPTYSVGSGFFIDAEGDIITNEHVVRGATELRVRLYDGREFPVCVRGQDEQADIALLQVAAPGKTAFSFLPLGDSDAVSAGTAVLAIGSPFGFAHSVTAGIVSANDRVVEPDSEGGRSEAPAYSFYIQTDASINVGNSGGPLIDQAGVVIGVNAAFWGGAQPASGVGFAIPANVVKLLVPRLRSAGVAPRAYLGVESQAVTPALAQALRLPRSRGALIASIERGGAADVAGLEVGDLVTRFGAHDIATLDDFRIFSQLTPPGTRIDVGVIRQGKPLVRPVETQPVPSGRNGNGRHAEDCRSMASDPAGGLGFDVQALPPERVASVPQGGGVQIVRITSGAARDANLEVGDVIVRVGFDPVGSPEEFHRRIAAWKAEAPLPLLVNTRTRNFWTALPGRVR